MLAFASIVSKSRYYDDEFHACYEELKRALKKDWCSWCLKCPSSAVTTYTKGLQPEQKTRFHLTVTSF